MNIPKAIELKTIYINHLPPGVNEDWITADKLSIEALKRVNRYRPLYCGKNPYLLPGETKE